jgi:hypothetical protein
MTNIPTEAEIQRVLELLKKSHPDKATREYAIKTIEGMKKFASVVVDRIEEDMESGRLQINDKGEITVDGKVIKKLGKKEKKLKGKHL